MGITLDGITGARYYGNMIQGFRDRETEKIFRRLVCRRLSPAVQHAALRKLLIVDAAEALQDLASPPGNRLEKLTGSREGQHSIRVNDQWRICFRWERGDAYEVEVADYH